MKVLGLLQKKYVHGLNGKPAGNIRDGLNPPQLRPLSIQGLYRPNIPPIP
ncbi:hypothetical protein JQX13_09905 [Archangium violaceum]|nr:hypothetical protein [Archangium violaceum]QRK10370.1 hypothetical protein JQX13_09905 [Archangium violaceum]